MIKALKIVNSVHGAKTVTVEFKRKLQIGREFEYFLAVCTRHLSVNGSYNYITIYIHE